jgi:hypothetical protein
MQDILEYKACENDGMNHILKYIKKVQEISVVLHKKI